MPTGTNSTCSPPRQCSLYPSSASLVRLRMVIALTAAILGKASPLKPKVSMAKRSARVSSLLVAWRNRQMRKSPSSIPQPSSVTRMSSSPPARMSMPMFSALASMAFSTNSFTAELGRSMTSPAAIWLASSVGRRLIFIVFTLF